MISIIRKCIELINHIIEQNDYKIITYFKHLNDELLLLLIFPNQYYKC